MSNEIVVNGFDYFRTGVLNHIFNYLCFFFLIEKDELIIRNAELSEKYELLKQVNLKQAAIEQQQQQNHHHNVVASNTFETKSRSASESMPQRGQPEDSSNNFHSTTNIPPTSTTTSAHQDEATLKALKDELNDKNKVIKTLQQRLNDLKKTLQKELKYQQLPNETTAATISLPSPLPQQQQHHQASHMLPASPHASSSDEALTSKIKSLQIAQQQINSNGIAHEISHNSSVGTNAAAAAATAYMSQMKRSGQIGTTSAVGFVNGAKKLDEINHKYLKHVVLKFLTSREYEVSLISICLILILSIESTYIK